MSKKRRYDEVSVLRVLDKNRSVSMSGKVIEVDSYSGQVGNNTWGKIDYLCKVHGYRYLTLSSNEPKGNRKQYTPKVVNPNKKDEAMVTAKAHPAKINMVNMTKMAMKHAG